MEAGVHRRWLERWAGLGGLLYVVFFVIGVILEQDGPNTDSAPEKLVAYWAQGSHRDKAAIGWFLVLIGIFFFLWFLAALRQAIRRLDGDGLLSGLVTVGGAVYAALSVAAITIDVVLKTHGEDTYRDEVYPQLVAVSDDFWWVLHSAGGIGGAAMIVGASAAALRARKVPQWAGWLGVLAGIAATVSIFGIPWIAIAAWIVIVSGILVLPRTQGAQSDPR